MKKLKSLLILLVIIQINALAQKIDTTKITKSLNAVVNSFESKSFDDFEKLLCDKDDYLELAKQMGINPPVENSEFDLFFQKLQEESKVRFIEIIKKGEDRGIIWEDVNFDGYVFNSEELMFVNKVKSEGFLVDSHLRVKSKDKVFTIIGVQLWLFENEYKIKGDELRGVFEIDLDIYVPADNLYLDEIDDDGY